MLRRKKKMTLLIIGIALIAAAAIGGVWWYLALFHGCNPPLPRRTITVGGTMFDVEMATTMVEQSCGLSGRESLADGQGMLFVFGSGSTQNFWMKDMNFALDMVWISGNQVAGFAQDVPPPAPGTQLWQLKIYTSPPNVDKVLEVPAGTVAKDGLAVGDAVTISP
ncbi:MAG TPA: DUF192 domain-containing protein [Candidatus Paceibacterota bacterium]|nr:DUF192 domain-containing protein [Candidatus Paceibacterota bacterium]